MDTGILENGCTNNDFLLNVKTKKNIRFKAGADVSSSVNIMDVSLDEDVTETHEFFRNKQSLRLKDLSES
jgi:hypothetical protein